MDTEQLELTQLNEKILQCLQLYDSLMQDQLSTMNSSYMPQLTNSMASMSMQVNSAISSFDNEKISMHLANNTLLNKFTNTLKATSQ